MLIGFFLHLKAARLPVSTREFLTLLEALEARVVSLSIDDFYYLARAALIKDEAQFDRYDLAFAAYFKGVEAIFDIRAGIPEEWLRKLAEKFLTDEEKAQIYAWVETGCPQGDKADLPAPKKFAEGWLMPQETKR